MSVCPSVRIKIKLSLIADKAMLARIRSENLVHFAKILLFELELY